MFSVFDERGSALVRRLLVDAVVDAWDVYAPLLPDGFDDLDPERDGVAIANYLALRGVEPIAGLYANLV